MPAVDSRRVPITTQRFASHSSGAATVSCIAEGHCGEIHPEPNYAIDQADVCILEIVQNNNRPTSEVIGEMAGPSATAWQRRLKRLRSEGIIQADVSIFRRKAIGRPIQMLVLVNLERERPDIIDRFKKAIKSSVEVVNGLYVTGDADFVLYITARTMEDYEQFTRRSSTRTQTRVSRQWSAWVA